MRNTRRVLSRVLRVGGYLAIVVSLFGILGARAVHAAIGRESLRIGDELLSLDGASSRATTDAYRLEVNGQRLHVSSASSSLAFTAVLDRFEAECTGASNAIAAEFSFFPQSLRASPPIPEAGAPGIATLRSQSEDRGAVFCFAQTGPTSASDALRKVGEFATTGDIGRIGNARYIVARRTEGGSHAVAAWADGELIAAKMFPQEGDAPGGDLADVPRPSGGRRVLTAFEEGAPLAVRVYETSIDEARVLADYDRDWPGQSWTRVPLSKPSERATRLFSRGGEDLLLTVERVDDKTFVSIVSYGATPAPRASVENAAPSADLSPGTAKGE